MKLKLTVILATCVVAMGLLLGTSAAQAATVIFEGDTSKATGIENLDIDGTLYNVAFTSRETVAEQVYGPFPGTFDFDTIQTHEAAVDAVNFELNRAGATGVGAEGSDAVPFFWVGFESEMGVDPPIEIVFLLETIRGAIWIRTSESGKSELYNFGQGVWADFTEVSEPVTIGGNVTGLEGSGLVLQNNGADDETIAADGEFTFETPLTPGDSYDVTVFTQPEGQTCSVENGTGEVPEVPVTNVAVTCEEAILGDLVKVAAEGDTLTDGTLLKQILLDGGVAINIDGQVAFGGRNGDNTIAVFTQDVEVAAEGETLDDDTTVVNDISNFGEVAISADRVAFHGRTGRDKAVFTQAGRVAKEDDILTSGTLNEIKDQGKVAINYFDVVAFHGKIEIEVGEGLGDTEEFSAVFTSDGLETRVAVQEGSELPDTSTVAAIDETGGVAINDFFSEVAFHGDVVDPETGVDTKKAVFTSARLVAAEGKTLEDGTTIVDDIDENGGVAINIFGEVAFHGDVVDPEAGGDTKKAVFTSAGLVAKEGGTLTDGTILEEISESGGVAINYFGDVAFHGRTGGVKAVFTQHGLIAKEGDPLADGTLGEIHDNGGVAINPYGNEVAFHGKVDSTDAVFVGQAPLPPQQ